jgi:hypothetical protein
MADPDYRGIVKQFYPNKTWARRVDNMSDAKVFAIYKSNQKKLEKEQGK